LPPAGDLFVSARRDRIGWISPQVIQKQNKAEPSKAYRTSGGQAQGHFTHIPHPLHRCTSTGHAHTPSAKEKARHRPHRYPSVSVDSTARRSSKMDDTPAQRTDIRLAHLPSLSPVRLACASAHVHTRRLQAERHPHGSMTAHRTHTSCSRRPPARSAPTHAHSRVRFVRRTHRIRTSIACIQSTRAPMEGVSAVMHQRRCPVAPSRTHAPPHTSSLLSLHAHQSRYLLRPTRRVKPSVNIFSLQRTRRHHGPRPPLARPVHSVQRHIRSTCLDIHSDSTHAPRAGIRHRRSPGPTGARTRTRRISNRCTMVQLPKKE
jgi:hypothetical protein